MNDNPLAHSGREEIFHSFSKFTAIEIIVDANLPAGNAPGFKLVHDAKIHVFERGEDDLRKSVTVFTDDVDARFQAGRLGSSEHLGCNGSVSGTGLVETVEQEQIAEVENPRAGFCEIEMMSIEQSVGSARMKEGPSTGALDRHHVCVARG